jgi:ribonuclease J
MYQWVRPRAAIPVHGEVRHMIAHARLARDCQIPEAVVPKNGSLVRLAPGPVEIVDEVPAGRLALDGTLLLPMGADSFRQRTRVVWHGAVVATVVLGPDGRVAGTPQLSMQGLFDGEGAEAVEEDIVDAIRDAIDHMPARARWDDAKVREAARLAVRRAIQESHGKKPATDIHLVRV